MKSIKLNLSSKLLVLATFLGTFLLVITFSSFFLHIQWIKKVFQVYFYRGCFLITFSSILVYICIIIFNNLSKKYRIKYALSNIFCAWCLLIGFFGVIPVSLDRSISVFIIGYMNKIDKPIDKEEIEKIFLDVYMHKYDAMERRIQEQTISGNFQYIAPNKYTLTNQGKNFIKYTKYLAYIFDCNQDFISPKM